MYSHRHPPPLLLLYATATAATGTATAESAASSAAATVNETLWLCCPASFSLWSLFTGKLKHFSIECGSNYAIALVSFGLGELFNQSDTELKQIAIESR